jgi:tRNA threonylcarbamoyl adenosine modification protein (Sua5/YciO/YrdC/YwlC family)
MRIRVFQKNPHKRVVDQALKVIQKGGIIIYPTDTVYGIGADIYNKKAIERIIRLKKETKFKALSLICSSFSQLTEFVKISNQSFKIMKHCLPGPYTFILEARKMVPKLMLSRQKTAGIRLPEDQFSHMLVNELGHPIISTSLPSVNGEVIIDPDNIELYFGKHVDLIVDAGFLGNEASSVISLVEDEIKIIREGKGNIDRIFL